MNKIKRFESLILKLQTLRLSQPHLNYEENCQKEINRVGEIILNEKLLDEQPDVYFSEQLLMMNCVPEKYWRSHG